MSNSTSHRRLFFALLPDADLKPQLTSLSLEIVSGTGGRIIDEDSQHITLAFLGDVPQTRLVDLAGIAGDLSGKAVDIVLTDIEYWADVKVAVLVSARPPAELMRFARSLHTELDARGLLNHSYDYRPHVTLAKNVEHRRMPTLARPIHWRSDRFALVESVTGEGSTAYCVIGAWGFEEGAMQPGLFPS